MGYQEEMRGLEERKGAGGAGRGLVGVGDELGERGVLELPQDVQERIKDNMKIFYKPRMNMDSCLQTRSRKKPKFSKSLSDSFE